LELSDLGLPSELDAYFANVRMGDWGGYILMSILGYMLGFESSSIYSANHLVSVPYFTVIALYLGFSFSINNCFDYKGDRLGVKVTRNPIALERISVRSGLLFSLALAASGLMITSLLLGSGPASIYLVMLLLSGAYSAPSPRFKSVPFIDMLSHGLFFGSLIVLFGLSVSGGSSPQTLLICAGIFLASIIVELNNQIEDAVADAEAGVRTTTVTIGLPLANRLFSALLAIHIAVMIYLLSQLGSLITTGLSVGFFMVLAYQLYISKERRSYFFLIEKVTPIVYFLFVFHIIL
jgi:4-hydroxybenzoate polyprenyltransferase